ncbi:phage tail protein [Rhizobium sp. ZK1]|uniref:phage tail protein n=1 Tax=Rhizobium sp. ZK1 TaxID=3389872 RepID=UPI0039F6A49B
MVELPDDLRKEVEAEVRRILGAEDVGLRRVWAEEAKNYREFLQSQFRWITIGVSSLAAVGVALFVWFFSDSVNQTQTQISRVLADAKDSMLMTIDSKVIDYRILQDLKSRVESMVEIEIGNQAEKATVEIIEPKITQIATESVDQAASKAINRAVQSELAKIKVLNVDDLIQRATIPTGAVIAFSRACPAGWTSYPGAAGRTIIGAGQGENLSSRSIEETGGAELHTLTIEELPQQTIEISGLAGTSSVDRYNAGGRDYPVVAKTSGSVTIGGGGKSFSTMPPFIALSFCRKD